MDNTIGLKLSCNIAIYHLYYNSRVLCVCVGQDLIAMDTVMDTSLV